MYDSYFTQEEINILTIKFIQEFLKKHQEPTNPGYICPAIFNNLTRSLTGQVYFKYLDEVLADKAISIDNVSIIRWILPRCTMIQTMSQT